MDTGWCLWDCPALTQHANDVKDKSSTLDKEKENLGKLEVGLLCKRSMRSATCNCSQSKFLLK